MKSLLMGLLLGILVMSPLGCGGGDGGGGGSTPPGIGPNGGIVTSSDGKASVTIPPGALSQEKLITVDIVSNPPSGNVGTAYEFGPSGITFSVPLTISITYDEAALPSGTNELDLKLAILINNQWQEVPGSSVNTTSNSVTGTTTSFSIYGVVIVSSSGGVPAAPTGVSATAGDGHVIIEWNSVNEATSYNLYMASVSGVAKSNYNSLADGMKHTGVTSPYNHTGLTNGKTYYFVVTAVNANGESSESSQVSATPVLSGTAPSAPTGVVVTPSDGQVTISWNPVSSATSYNLYMASVSGVNKSNYSSLADGMKHTRVTSPFTHTGLINGTTYYFVVTALNDDGESVESVQVSATPTATSPPTVTTMAASSVTDTAAALNGVVNPNGYSTTAWFEWGTTTSYVSTTANQPVGNGTSSGSITADLTGLAANTTYHFRIVAQNENGTSYGTDQTFTTMGPPIAPTVLTATAGKAQVMISWNAVSGADSYKVYWDTTSPVTKTTGSKIAEVTSPYLHTGLTNGITYYYVVTSVNTYGESIESNEVSVTPNAATAIAAGIGHTCALLIDGTVKCWGDNTYGQLGNGTTTQSYSPIPVIGITTAAAIASGPWHTCAVLSDGTVKCWGYNVYGQLGNGTTTGALPNPTPVMVTGIATATTIAASDTHTCAILSDGTVKCWGYNGDGQLGNGTTASSSTPVSVSGIATATAVATGGSYRSCAVLSDGTAQCWGRGYLGDGTMSNSSIPVTVSGVTTATDIATGADHTCVVLSDGTARCWGYNNIYGQFGNGTTTSSTTPLSVTGITNATTVTAGTYHTCTVLSDGTVTCWGYNAYGQLGDGTTTSSATPIVVTGISTATTIASEVWHTCAVLSSGTVTCWGYNAYGQLGNGSVINSSTPVDVVSLF